MIDANAARTLLENDLKTFSGFEWDPLSYRCNAGGAIVQLPRNP